MTSSSGGFTWQEKIAAELEAIGGPEKRKGRGKPILFAANDAITPLVTAAAEMRGCSLTSYVRRATFAMIAHDLGLEVSGLTALDPRVGPKGASTVYSDPGGTMYGPWRITGVDL